MKKIPTLVLFALITLIGFGLGIGSGSTALESSAIAQVGQAKSVIDDATIFSVAVSPIKAFVAPDADQIEANGKRYFLIDSAPKKVEAVLIVTEGDHKNWIVVRKLSGGKSRKLIPFEKNQFLFEHSGAGEYEVTSLDPKNEPVFDYFEVEGDEVEEPGSPVDPGDPPSDFAGLIKVAKDNANSDLATRAKLGKAWLDVLSKPTNDLSELKRNIGKARADVLSMVRDQDGSWNKFLLAVDGWFVANQSDYSNAMRALSEWMTTAQQGTEN